VRVAVTAVLLAAIAGSAAGASVAHLPFKRAVLSSDLIVVGRLTDVRPVESPPDSAPLRPGERNLYYQGRIEPERVLWPDSTATESVLTLRWHYFEPIQRESSNVVTMISGSSRGDRRRHERKRVLWLLQKDGRGAFMAEVPERAVPLETELAIRAARIDVIARDDHDGLPEQWSWQSEPRFVRLKNYLDESLAELEAESRKAR
jgi:hypothetical protein